MYSVYMKRRVAILLALGLLVVALAYGVHAWTSRGMFLLGDPSWPSQKLSSLQSIELLTAGGPVQFVSDTGNWYAQTPEGLVLANKERLQELLDAIGQKPPVAHVGRFTRREKQRYGLDNENIGITLRGKTVWGISLGNDVGDNATVYARSSLQGDQVVQLDASFRDLFGRNAERFYDLRLTGAPRQEDIVKVGAEGPGVGVWEILRKGDDFVFSAPEQQKRHSVAQAKVELYLHTLVSARARGVAALPQDKLPPPQLKLFVWSRQQSEPDTVELYHNGNDGKTFIAIASRHKTPLVVSADQVEKLAVSAFALREKPVLETDLGQVERQRFILHRKDASRATTVARSENGWKQTPGGHDVTGLDVIMWRLGSLQFMDAPRTTLPGGAELLLTWELFATGQQMLATIYFYTDPVVPGRCWVRVQGEDIFFPVDRLFLNDLMSRLPAM